MMSTEAAAGTTTSSRLRQTTEEMRSVFRLFDMAEAGCIRSDELPLLLHAVGIDATMDDVQLQLTQLFGVQHGPPNVSFRDFVKVVESMSIEADSEEEASHVFDALVARADSERVGKEKFVAHDGVADATQHSANSVLLPNDIAHLLRAGAPFLKARDPSFSVGRLYQGIDRDNDGVISRGDWIEFFEAAGLIRQ